MPEHQQRPDRSPRRRAAILLVAGLMTLATTATAQTPRLVKDLNTTPPPNPSSSPTELTEMGGNVYFGATTETLGSELFMSFGVPGQGRVVKDISPGRGSSARRA